MKKSTLPPLLLILISFTCFNVAQAEGYKTYAGIHVGTADTSIDGVNDDVDLDFLMAQLGVWMTDNATIEARMAIGNDDDSVGPFDIEIENFGGLYGTYHWFFSDYVSAYGIAGWSTASLKVSGNGASDQEDDNGLSYGVGMKFSIVNIEYMKLLDTSDVEMDLVSVGLQYSFD